MERAGDENPFKAFKDWHHWIGDMNGASASTLIQNHQYVVFGIRLAFKYVLLSTLLPLGEQCGLFRGDGRRDFFARLKDPEPWLFFYRTESGAFVEATKGPAVDVDGYLFVTDWNSDGWPDLLLLGGLFPTYLQNTVEGKMRRNSFRDHFRDIDMARAARFHAVDWNEDGEGDIVVKEDGHLDQRGRLRLYELHHGRYREAVGIFDNVTIAYGPGTSAEALVDWDFDGDLDLVVAEKLEAGASYGIDGHLMEPYRDCWFKLRYYEKTPGGYTEDSQHALAEFSELTLGCTPWNPGSNLQPIPIDRSVCGHFLEHLENGSFRERMDSPFKSLPEASRFGLFCDMQSMALCGL